MSKFEEYLEAVKSVVEVSGKGTDDVMKIIKSGKAIARKNGVQLFSEQDLDIGAVVAFNEKMYPNANVDELKDKYEIYIKKLMKKKLGPNPMKKDLMEIDDISLDYWPEEEANEEIMVGFEGFVYGDIRMG